jgi:uncharacterized Zn finger protein
MGYWSWKPYVPVAARRRKAENVAAKAKKRGATLSPIEVGRGAIAKTFWGKAWCDNLERYSDFSNRLPRGRTYVRNGSVIDLRIAPGAVKAQVVGSSLYQVDVTVARVPEAHWRSISTDCAGSIDSLVELLQGKLSRAVMERICRPGTGLFPDPKSIQFSCTCPDWAVMCKHVAAVLYGVGARLDREPEVLFVLRGVEAQALVAQASAGLPQSGAKAPAAGKRLEAPDLSAMFGIEMAEPAAPATAGRPKHGSVGKATAPTAAKTAARTTARTTARTAAKTAARTAAKAAAKHPASGGKPGVGAEAGKVKADRMAAEPPKPKARRRLAKG